MTPARIMAALEANGPLPREALEAAGQSRDEMVPVSLDYIGKLQSAEINDLEGMDAFVFIFFLLAEWRETRAYRPLSTLLRRDPEFLDALLGESITEASARVMAGVFDGDLQPLFDILLYDAADDPGVRDALRERRDMAMVSASKRECCVIAGRNCQRRPEDALPDSWG